MVVEMNLVSVKRHTSHKRLPSVDATILTKARSPPVKLLRIRLYKEAKDYLYIKETEVECGTKGEINLELVARQLQVNEVRVSNHRL
jgi:hypothetical protein